VPPGAILDLVEALDQVDAMNSFMLVRHGHVIAEGWWAPYSAQDNHELYSLSKSFTSTAVGMAVAEGKLSIDDEVLKFFPDDAPAERSANLKAMRVRDLLTMSAGHQDETSTAADKISAKAFLAHPVPHKPGTHFKYNTPATFMLSAIVQKQTGQTVLDYLRPRLFEPLGITQPVWNTNWQGISLGGYGLSVRTEDIARFGQLYLQKGNWQGKQLIQREWVELATSRQVSNGSNPRSDWDQGYGFQFWRCRNGAVSRRRRVRPILHCAAGTGRGNRHHQRREGYARGAQSDLGEAVAGLRNKATPGARRGEQADGETRRFDGAPRGRQ
jgi:CubicO group peptidase (beta-lactamase class C family)